jgi:hypothetical protein
MVFEAVHTQKHASQILTINFQFSGQLEVLGDISTYINDARRDSLSLHDAYLNPLTPGTPIKGFKRPFVIVRRPQIVFMYLNSPETQSSVQLLQRKELLVAYTPIAVCQGYFHMSAEARVADFVDAVQHNFVPVTQARIFPLIELPAPFPTEADLILIGRSQLQSYHTV